MTLSFVIPGAPRTKKTSNNLVFNGPRCAACKRGRFPKVMPSDAFKVWNANAQHFLGEVTHRWPAVCPFPITKLVNCRALFYRHALVGDACGYYQALADALEEARVVENDRLIVSWDGSRMLKDAADPRIEITLEVL